MVPREDKSKLESIVRACRLITRMRKASGTARKSELLYYQMLSNYFNRLLKAEEESEFIVAHTVFFPAEIIYSMGLVPMHTETTTWMISLFTGECADLISGGAELGLVSEICSPHRGVAGAYHIKALPRPDAILWSNMICDNTAKCGELIMEINGIPGFFLDHPFQDTPDERNYLTGELKEMVHFLEHYSGKKMDWERLTEIVTMMDRQIELFREINELRKAIPTPFRAQGFLELISVDYLCPGQPEAIEYLETLRDELAEMVKNGRGAVPNERFRLMTLFIPPMYLIGFIGSLSEQYGAVSVTEPFFTHYEEGKLDPGRPLESVTQKSFMLPEMRMYGPMDGRAINSIEQCAQEYKVNGAIYYADVGCRQSCATIKLFKDVLNDIDVPVLTLDCDVVDPTITSKEEVKDKMERFFELLEER
jgi:benzoyl-CoA reductase/2-hydroxyglutaryl-CoA dehydratase subunit BcrC/BadD/HgdB